MLSDEERSERSYKYYEFATYKRSPYLEALASGEEPLGIKDVDYLFRTFVEGCEDAGVAPTLVDFGIWLAGTEPFERPADVVW